jgi:UDP-N-acetylmuramoyl-tripeptide--D-alanyl-D-alanine ligase
MQHALESFSKSSTKNKLVILGDMFELGEYAAIEHQKIADLATQLKFDKIVLVGLEFNKTQTNASILKFQDSNEAHDWFKEQEFTDTEILLKGSRSMKMEKVLN